MNRLVVRQTTAGLMRWLPDGAKVVIGFDARHGSAPFAAEVARVVAALGGVAEMLPGPLPTPVLAHAVLARSATAGVMITASHNPPQDNGYKLYLDDGIQLVSPDDAAIAATIDDVAENDPSVELVEHPERIHILSDDVAAGHVQAAISTLAGTARQVRTVYTAMHGVGGAHLLEAFEAAGFPTPSVVPEQFDPDPDFPTAAFPNPEEAGALDLALALAAEVGADLVLANDPDADRLALAVPARKDNGFVALSGDQIGVLLADHLLRSGVAADHAGGRVVANSVVSSRLLSKMAEANGVDAVTTLTGFKWVARPIVERPEQHYLLGYEEAIGYCIGGVVRDKDGISAALVAAEMVAVLIEQGITVWDRLDALAVEHGLHLTAPVTIRFDGPDGTTERERVMERFQEQPPAQLDGVERTDWLDLSAGEQFPPATGIIANYGTTRVIVRPSGTEPKLKAYIEVIEPVAGPSELDRARREGAERLQRIRDEIQNVLAG
jgi:phosphomannomutase